VGPPPSDFYARTGDGLAPSESATPPARARWSGSGYGSREVPRLEAIQLARRAARPRHTHNCTTTHAHTSKLARTQTGDRYDAVLLASAAPRCPSAETSPRQRAGAADAVRYIHLRHSPADIAARSSLSDAFPSLYGSSNFPHHTALRDPFGVVRCIIIINITL